MADKGCVALDWDHAAEDLPADAPVVILLPGMVKHVSCLAGRFLFCFFVC